jgi:hypothetical protein
VQYTIIGGSSAENTVDSIYECLIQGKVGKITKKVIHNYIYDKITTLENIQLKKKNLETFIAKQDRLWRDDLKSIQREMMTIYMRLHHYSSSTHIPTFSDLSTSHSLDEVSSFSGELHNVGGYVKTLPTLFYEHIKSIGNIDSHLKQIDQINMEEKQLYIELRDALDQLKSRVLSLYEY